MLPGKVHIVPGEARELRELISAGHTLQSKQMALINSIRGRISRNGRHEIRRVLLQCAHAVARTKRYEARPLKEFFERIKKRRGKKIAVVALVKKLLALVYGVLKNKKAYAKGAK